MPKNEYERYTKYQAKAADALKKTKRGNKELRSGMAKVIKSISELM